MGFPIIGGNKAAERAAQSQEKEQMKFHQLKRMELLKWEIENECIVTNKLHTENTITKMSFEALFIITKASNDQVNAMKKISS